MCECRRITLRQVREEWCWDSGHRTVQHGSAEQQTAWGRLSDYTDCDLETYVANILVI